MNRKILILGALLSLIFLFNNFCAATSGKPIDSVDQNSSLVGKYKEVGINLKEELEKGNLYQKDGQYFIKFKEPSLKKWVLKRLKDTNNLDIREVSLENALLLDAISVPDSNIKRLDNFKMFLNVTYINLEENKNIKDHSSLKYLKKLNSLYLKNNNLQNIKFLKYVSSELEYLNLGSNQIKNIQSIKNLIKLKSLTLYGNKIKELSALSSLDKLETLWLMDNHIKSLKGFENLNNLAFLYLDGNPLTLKGLKSIEKLNLYELTIDRKVFDGIVATKYPEFLWDIENLEFIEGDEDE